MTFEWDQTKAKSKLEKHGVDFADAVAVLFDDRALTILDDCEEEERFATVGMDALGRVLVVICCFRDGVIRLISARKAIRAERLQYEEQR